jgi:hypothetical protein
MSKCPQETVLRQNGKSMGRKTTGVINNHNENFLEKSEVKIKMLTIAE